MKKVFTACLAGAIACTVAFSAAGCGGSADVKGDSFSDPALTIQSGKVSEALDISDMLFGLFLEDINYASYGLDDNLVANGNFEALSDTSTSRFSSYWSSVGGASFSVKTEDGIFANHAEYHSDELGTNVNPHYAEVKVTAAGGGIQNSGYSQVPMAFTRGAQYKFSAFVKSPDGDAKLTVRAVSTSGTAYINETINIPQGNEWIKYERTVNSTNNGTKDIHLELTFDQAGTYLVDAVQLETLDSTVGIKNYIYNAIADLSPKFMRFPGGCIIEGDSANGGADCVEVYDWKNSVGAVQNGTNAGDDTIPAFTYKLDANGTAKETTTYGEWATRTNNYDLWGYNMDYGLGFYEYFLLCDSIGASPVPIVNCGFSDQGGAASGNAIILNGRHGAKVADYVQDALNLVEFANGDTTTKWGKIRANMGHEAPFNLKYIGIGNEQFGGIYFDCYQQFLVAFTAAQKANPEIYGGVQPIVGNGMVFSDCEYAPNSANVANNAARSYLNGSGKSVINNISEYGVVDHHYYMTYLDFLHYAMPENCIYDNYSRNFREDGYKVFVGEYSANFATNYFGSKGPNESSYEYKSNTWMTALSEAAYMTALERNGDVVDLAAYAPMFGVSNGRTRDDSLNQWNVDMMYFTNTELLLSPNYFVQQIFMKNSGTHYLNSSFVNISDDYPYDFRMDGVSIDYLYQAITYDKATGDIIVKIVNAGEETFNVNVDLAGAKVKGIADVTVLTGEYGGESMNTLGEDGYEVKPSSYTLGVKSLFGYTVPEYSVTVIRVHTK